MQKKFQNRIRNIFDNALAQYIAGLLTVIGTFFFAILVSEKLMEFLTTILMVPVYLGILVSIFSVFGVVKIANALWNSISYFKASKSTTLGSKDEFEAAVADILKEVIHCETGFYLDPNDISDHKAAVLITYEEWERLVHIYTKENYKDRTKVLRDKISGAYLPQAYKEAKSWRVDIKEISEVVREKLN